VALLDLAQLRVKLNSATYSTTTIRCDLARLDRVPILSKSGATRREEHNLRYDQPHRPSQQIQKRCSSACLSTAAKRGAKTEQLVEETCSDFQSLRAVFSSKVCM
jgi:hypothetical protein